MTTTMTHVGPWRFQFSVRTVLLVTVLLALSLVPVVWVERQRQQLLRAREEALRAVILAERYRAESQTRGAADPRKGPSKVTATDMPAVTPEILIEHLRKENNELKDTVDSLRREVQSLRAAAKKP